MRRTALLAAVGLVGCPVTADDVTADSVVDDGGTAGLIAVEADVSPLETSSEDLAAPPAKVVDASPPGTIEVTEPDFGVLAQALAPYDNTSPETTGCAASAITVDRRDLGGGRALLELRYSTSCRTVWARVTLTAGACDRALVIDCPTAYINRNSDGYMLWCTTPQGSNASCYTRQINDAGVTSYASAQVDTGPYHYTVRTISY